MGGRAENSDLGDGGTGRFVLLLFHAGKVKGEVYEGGGGCKTRVPPNLDACMSED